MQDDNIQLKHTKSWAAGTVAMSLPAPCHPHWAELFNLEERLKRIYFFCGEEN